MKKKALSLLLALFILCTQMQLVAYADEGAGQYLVISYEEYDADGKQLRNTAELIEDGLLPREMTFVMTTPDGGEITIPITFQVDEYTREYIHTKLWTPTQTGTYTFISYPMPEGYELIKREGYTFSDNDLSFVVYDVSADFSQQICTFYIAKIGTFAPAQNENPADAPTPEPPAASDTLTAAPTSSAVLVNGESVSFDAYNIGGNNYFKLRDLAYILSGTEKQFEVGWDGANNAISLTSGQSYTAVSGEMEGKGTGDKTPAATTSKIYLDGKEVTFTAYNIDGNNYFKLRDIGQAFDFGVDWDGENNTIIIDTSKGYTA